MNINVKYQNLLSEIMTKGFEYEDPNRRGVIRKQIPYYTLQHDFEEGFPIIGLKQTYPRMAFNEMKAFMLGKNTLRDLEKLGITFWRKDAYNFFMKNSASSISFDEYMSMLDNDILPYTTGTLGKIYPHQIRNWNDHIDQLDFVLDRLKDNPMTTKNIVTMWNPSDEHMQALTPCHTRFSFVVEKLPNKHYGYIIDFSNDNPPEPIGEGVPQYGLRIQWNQDSVDTFLGLPMNIMYYSFACHVFANYLGMKPLGIIGNLTNVHLYDNSFEAVNQLLTYDVSVLNDVHVYNKLPTIYNSLNDYLDQIDYVDHFKMFDYKHLGRHNVEMLPYSK